MGSTLTIVLISLLFSAFFSGMEIAFLSANRLKLEIKKKEDGLIPKIISIYSNNTEQYIATMLVGNNIALVVYSIEMAKLLTPVIQHIFPSPLALLLVQTLLSTIIILVTAEFLPKSIFRLHSNAFLTIFSLPIFLFYLIFFPVSKFTSWLSFWIIRLLLRIKIKSKNTPPIFGKVDLDHLVDEVTSQENTENSHMQELKIFQNALDFSEIRLRDCMIPRTDIEAVDISITIPELRQKFNDTKFSRLPVYKESIDNIIGYLNSKALFLNPTNIENMLLDIDFFPETMQANKALSKFIKEHKSIAIVVDEFGGTAGLVTIEDTMEEIFGEIDDEHDLNEFIEKKVNDTDYIFSGRLEVKHLNETYGLNIPETDYYETLAGFILYHHQSIPKPNEIFDAGSFSVKILRMDDTRIDLVRLTTLKM
ncbi:MAG: HlyC/CorC family transporter [Bacteroidales bacterium]|nr:HlyC/CorC family transporter [Bacteroidales bacterium]